MGRKVNYTGAHRVYVNEYIYYFVTNVARFDVARRRVIVVVVVLSRNFNGVVAITFVCVQTNFYRSTEPTTVDS